MENLKKKLALRNELSFLKANYALIEKEIEVFSRKEKCYTEISHQLQTVLSSIEMEIKDVLFKLDSFQ